MHAKMHIVLLFIAADSSSTSWSPAHQAIDPADSLKISEHTSGVPAQPVDGHLPEPSPALPHATRRTGRVQRHASALWPLTRGLPSALAYLLVGLVSWLLTSQLNEIY